MPAKDGHRSQYKPGQAQCNFTDADQHTTTNSHHHQFNIYLLRLLADIASNQKILQQQQAISRKNDIHPDDGSSMGHIK